MNDSPAPYDNDDPGHSGERTIGPAFRTLPHNIDAERGFLGAVLVDNRAFERASEFLRAEHFVTGQHKLIFEACAKLIERGQIANPITLKPWFEISGTLDQVGGTDYLSELAANSVTVINAGEYGRIIYDLHLKRELITIGQEIVEGAYNGEINDAATNQVEKAEQRLSDISEGAAVDHSRTTKNIADATTIEMEAAFHRRGGISGISTGFSEMDKIIKGLRKGMLLILAGRPGMGKSVLASNIAEAAARNFMNGDHETSCPIGFFSLEMSGEDLIIRMAAKNSTVELDKIISGEYSNDTEAINAMAAAKEIGRIPFYIDDSAGLTTQAIKSRARRWIKKYGIGLLIIDHMGRLASSNKFASETEKIGQIAQDLKNIAKQLGIPVIALCQLSRGVESREDKRPTLSDLRQSGRIEEEADVVAFVYRAEYYLQKSMPIHGERETGEKFNERLTRWNDQLEASRNKGQIIVDKLRQGQPGTAELGFEGQYGRFYSLKSTDQSEINFV